MSKPDLSTYGGALLEVGYAGQVVDLQYAELDSRVNEGATAIDFGIAVAYGANEIGCKAISADADKILGISARWPIRPANQSGDVTYAQRDALPVMRKGNIFVVALENTAIGDAAISVTAQGGKIGSTTGGAAGAGRVAIPGAVWQTATTAGQVGKVRINSAV